MRHDLDESGRLDFGTEFLGRLPAELVRLINEWIFLEFCVSPSKGARFGIRARTEWAPGSSTDPARENLRKFRDRQRKAFDVIANQIHRMTHEVKRCPKCNALNSWQDAWCGESFPEGSGCGYTLIGETRKVADGS